MSSFPICTSGWRRGIAGLLLLAAAGAAYLAGWAAVTAAALGAVTLMPLVKPLRDPRWRGAARAAWQHLRLFGCGTLLLAGAIVAAALIGLALSPAAHAPGAGLEQFVMGAGASIVVALIAGLAVLLAGVEASTLFAAALVAIGTLAACEPAFAQTIPGLGGGLDSVVSGVQTKGNEAVSALRKIAVIALNLAFVVMGGMALMKKIPLAYAGLAILGAILINFSDKFSSWLGSFGGSLGIPGI